MSEPLFSVVVATRNRSIRLVRLLQLLTDETHPWPIEIVVVDDASTDDTPQRLDELTRSRPNLCWHRLGRSSGPGHARNVGWRSATGRYVAFTDDDCRPQPGWLEALARGHESGVDVVQGPTIPDPEDYDSRTALSHWIDVSGPSFRFETCNISYRRGLLDALGGFDTTFGTSRGGAPYGEDADLGWRATEAGATFAFVDDGVVVHDVVTDGFTTFLARRLRRESMPYFVKKHPGYRRLLPNRWLMSAAHPPAVIAGLGLVLAAVVALAWSPLPAAVALLATIPYIHHRIARDRVAGRRRLWPVAVAAAWSADIVEIAALARGSIRWRCLLL